jgi:hypothetical protein
MGSALNALLGIVSNAGKQGAPTAFGPALEGRRFMPRVLLFGGRRKNATIPESQSIPDQLRELLAHLSWKYVTSDAHFPKFDYATVDDQELREDLAQWVGRVWCHEHGMPPDEDLAHFDLMALRGEFEAYVKTHGSATFERGLSLEEIWAAQQLYSREPMILLLNNRYANQPLTHIPHKQLFDSDMLVWLLAALCIQFSIRNPSFNVLVSNQHFGHTVSLAGLNSVQFWHPRGIQIQPGWLSFHDPWPARSLLAPERNFAGVAAFEDITRPPYWLISPPDLDRVIVGFLLSPVMLSALLPYFQLLDMEASIRRMSPGSRLPMWVEDASRPDALFSAMLQDVQGRTATADDTLSGLAFLAFHGYGDLLKLSS